jgi:uncharacterized protein YoxC
VIHGIS